MSDDKISLEFLAARVGAVTDQMHDLDLRFASLETHLGTIDSRISTLTTVMDARFAAVDARFAGLERRFAILEDRQNRILSILVRMAERQGLPPESRAP